MAGQTTNYLFDYPTSTDYVKDGATAIETLADDVDATLFTALGGAYPGLRLIKKQTIGSGVGSVVVNSAFSATYENYKIVVSDYDASGTDDLLFVSVNGTTGSNYTSTRTAVSNSTGALTSGASPSSGGVVMGLTSSSNSSMIFDVITPFLTTKTYFLNASSTGSAFNLNSQGFTLTNDSSTAFTITPGGGTLTGGTIYVYGYGAS
jgi:hypothetical protein